MISRRSLLKFIGAFIPAAVVGRKAIGAADVTRVIVTQYHADDKQVTYDLKDSEAGYTRRLAKVHHSRVTPSVMAQMESTRIEAPSPWLDRFGPVYFRDTPANRELIASLT